MEKALCDAADRGVIEDGIILSGKRTDIEKKNDAKMMQK